jgi:hypothetical protein
VPYQESTRLGEDDARHVAVPAITGQQALVEQARDQGEGGEVVDDEHLVEPLGRRPRRRGDDGGIENQPINPRAATGEVRDHTGDRAEVGEVDVQRLDPVRWHAQGDRPAVGALEVAAVGEKHPRSATRQVHRRREAESRRPTRDHRELAVETLVGGERRERAPHTVAVEHAREDGGDRVVLVEPRHAGSPSGYTTRIDGDRLGASLRQ